LDKESPNPNNNTLDQTLDYDELLSEFMQKNLQIKKLFEVSQRILSSLNTDNILDFLLHAIFELIPFDAAVIFLFDPDSNKLYKKISKGYDRKVDLTLKLGQGSCGWVAQHKKSLLLNNVNKAKYYFPVRKETRSQITLPIQIHDELIGVLCLESNKLNHFTKQSLDILNLFANQAAIALNNAKQYEISLAKKSLEHELVKASQVQRVLLPERPPVIQNINISFSHIASKIVSGDLFDLVPINDKTLGVIIGDVSGKGAQAAIMMALLLAGFRSFKKTHLAVCEIVARLNNLLYESISDGRFATLFYTIISTEANTLTYTNAGHNPPILIRENGAIEKLEGSGLVLGFLPNEIYKQITVPFHKGDTLVCYTDGLTEAFNFDGIEFGEERLIEVLQKNIHLNSYELKHKILAKIRRFSKRDDFKDDLTIVIVKFH
jgi:serine phosphatase RsbU (regulator of sigma subunit)